jgi:hypothetical protein
MENQMTDRSLAKGQTEAFGSVDRDTGMEGRVLRVPVGTSLADAERWMIYATLKKCGGNKTRAAALLGVSLKTLYNRLNAYRLEGVRLDQGIQFEEQVPSRSRDGDLDMDDDLEGRRDGGTEYHASASM